MFLIIIGIIILIIAAIVFKQNPVLEKFRKPGRIIGFGFIVLGLLSACIVQVNPGEIGVKVLFWKYSK